MNKTHTLKCVYKGSYPAGEKCPLLMDIFVVLALLGVYDLISHIRGYQQENQINIK